MTAAELQALLRRTYPKEDERHEWKRWHSLKHHVNGRQGDDAASYVSAIANMDGGALVLGVRDGDLQPTGLGDTAGYTPEKLKFRLAEVCLYLGTEGLEVQELRADDSGARVWVVHIPRHRPRQPVLAHGKPWQRLGDSLAELRDDRARAILAEPLVGDDWSAVTVAGATLADLDPQALALARLQYARRHVQERWAAEIGNWSDARFLDRARLSVHGRLTRTALLLLGRPECAALLSPHPAEIVWKLPEERVAKGFGPPFLLATTAVLTRIRNPVIKIFPESQLIPVQVPRYEPQLVLEALHNCIAHQDYDRGERVVVEEWPQRLRLSNAGSFVDGRPEDYFQGERTPRLYRNPWLAAAMNEIGMIDRGGFGIRDMLLIQRRRFLPLPDYEGSDALQTVFNVQGRSLSLDYSRLLMERPDLDFADVLLLDRVQKGLPLNAEQRRHLRGRGLIEGRGERITVSAGVATATGREAEYVTDVGLEAQHYRALVLKLLALGPQPRSAINRLLLDKLPASVQGIQRRRGVIKSLLQGMAQRGEIENVGGSTKAARWALKRP